MTIIWGKVRKGHQRGKDLGFPTANLHLNKNISDGIYISKIRVDSKWFQALTFIGAAEKFNEKDKKAETYILDFDENLYGKWMTVKLLKKIRESEKFESVEKLKEQMKEDERRAREYFEDKLQRSIVS